MPISKTRSSRSAKQLADTGWDAGARTISYHLAKRHEQVAGLSTIHRVLTRRGFVTPQPQKRPRSSWQRFESALPNDCWQSDMTHWQLENGAKVEFINFIDDYSRAVLCSVVVSVATAAEVVRLFYDTAATWGLPASVLSDNGAIYTAACRGSHHIGVGRAHIGRRVLILIADLDVRVIDVEGAILRHFLLDPSVDYQAQSRDIV